MIAWGISAAVLGFLLVSCFLRPADPLPPQPPWPIGTDGKPVPANYNPPPPND